MTINWENNIVIWAPPFRNKIKCWLHASWKMFLQLNPLLWQCRSRYYSCRARPWVVGLRLGSLCSLFWPITTHLAALHKLCDTSSMDRKFENIGSRLLWYWQWPLSCSSQLRMEKPLSAWSDIADLIQSDLIHTFFTATQLYLSDLMPWTSKKSDLSSF